ncbi:unnamed protein product [Linum trigynum]|uniref:Glycosyltransferase n=1 Tax=Linum trigynum TaxID=586398 RepID=A0AAV2FUE0_9ROSI
MANTPAPHILVIPFPSQGHVIPLMKLSVCLATQFGFRITFLNLQSKQVNDGNPIIRMVHIFEGEGNNKSTQSVQSLMPGRVEELIDQMNATGSDAITCVLADQTNGWAFEIAVKRGITRVGFCPAAAAMVAVQFSIPRLIRDGIIDQQGAPTKDDQTVKLAQEMPALRPSEFVWNCFGDDNTRKHMFELVLRSTESMRSADWLLCNSAHDIEPGSFGSIQTLLPIGPLGSIPSSFGSLEGEEDQVLLNWLDQHPPDSVIYVAFGSTTLFDPSQLEELALGLELTNRPFCWVVRPDHITPEIEPVLDRVGGPGKKQGKIVSWAPQEKVLGHPSVGCFVSHCGWNSTMEGLASGVPFLCWPYFADQFLNASYVCDVWKVGLRLEREDGNRMMVVTKEEIRKKVDRLVGSVELKERSSEIKRMVRDSVGERGSSTQNLMKFAEWVRGL